MSATGADGVLPAIREYDAQNHTNLEQTALVYVKENMEIAAAAKVLFQHPNTVRYRLSKIQRIIGMEDDPLFCADAQPDGEPVAYSGGRTGLNGRNAWKRE